MLTVRARVLFVAVLAVTVSWGVVTSAAATPGYQLQWPAAGGGPLGIAADGTGNVYYADPGEGSVTQYTSSGAFVRVWTSNGSGPIDTPTGVAVNRFHQVIVTENAGSPNAAVHEYSSTGAVQRHIGYGFGGGDGYFQAPYGVAVDRFGFIYVTDAAAKRVQKFLPTGGFLMRWGSLGTGPGEFNSPYGIAVDALGNVYVGDSPGRIEKFTSDGQFVTQWSTHTANGLPRSITIGLEGNVYVCDTIHGTIDVFTPDGGYLYSFGSPGPTDGHFTNPSGVTVDGSGVFVSDTDGDRIQKFSLGAEKPVTRIGGSDRYAVAVNLAAARWPGFKGIKHVIVVCGEDRANADPLASAGLAGVIDAPVLLTNTSKFNLTTKNALLAMRSTNGPLVIHVIGGTTSIPKAVYNKIAATNPGGSIERISGRDRYDLSVAIANRVNAEAAARSIQIPAVLVFNAEDSKAFYQALAASPYSASAVVPMLGVRGKSVPPSVGTALGSTFAAKPRYVVNSLNWISAGVYSAVGASGRLTTSSDRAESAKQMAGYAGAAGWTVYRNVGLANRLPDALTGGTFIGQQGGVLLYTDKSPLNAGTGAFASSLKPGSLAGWAFGGEASIAANTFNQFKAAVNAP